MVKENDSETNTTSQEINLSTSSEESVEHSVSSSQEVILSGDFEREKAAHLGRALRQAIGEAREEYFENGLESRYSSFIKSLLNAHHSSILPLIYSIFQMEDLEEIKFQTLRILGRNDDKETHTERRSFMESMLSSRDSYLRAGAVEALALMEDPASRPALENALLKETSRIIVADIEQLLSYL